MDHGKIMERGTHEELVATGKLYATMVQQQESKDTEDSGALKLAAEDTGTEAKDTSLQRRASCVADVTTPYRAMGKRSTLCT